MKTILITGASSGFSKSTAEDIAKTIKCVIDQPEHVNIDNIEIMPLAQTFGGMVINRL